MMNRGCSWPMKWEAGKWFLRVSQHFHPMFKIYKYIVVDSHVWSEWHTCHIVSLLRFFSRSLTGPFRHKTWCPLFWAMSRTGRPKLQETGHSVACESGLMRQWPFLKTEVSWECFVLLRPSFLLSSSPETDLEWFIIPRLLLEMREVGTMRAAHAAEITFFPRSFH